MIGLFNSLKIRSSKIKASRTCEITEIFYQFLASLNWILLRCLILFTFPILLGTFLVLNCIPVVRTLLPFLNDFSVFIKVCFLYLTISINFTTNVTLSLLFKFYQRCMSCINYILLCLFFCSATVLASLVLLAGDIHTNPDPLTFCHWKLGELPTDNYAKKTFN